MHELAQQFAFDADAEDVYAFIMGDETQRPRVIRISDGQFAIQCVFLIGETFGALYGIVLGVHLMAGDTFDFLREDAHWLVWDREAAHITLNQDRPGECRAELHIETDPQRWQRRPDGPWVVPMNVGTRLITQIWREHIVQAWIAHRANSNRGKTISRRHRNATPGRRRLKENEWAYRQVNELGRKPEEVFPEWYERAGERVKALDDPQDSFKKAIKPRK